MIQKDIKKVMKLVTTNGDQFWSETDDDGNTNSCLFEDIIKAVNDGGYDLKLIKKGGK